MFELLGFTKEQAEKQFGFLMNAFHTEHLRMEELLLAWTGWFLYSQN